MGMDWDGAKRRTERRKRDSQKAENDRWRWLSKLKEPHPAFFGALMDLLTDVPDFRGTLTDLRTTLEMFGPDDMPTDNDEIAQNLRFLRQRLRNRGYIFSPGDVVGDSYIRFKATKWAIRGHDYD
jgi:hypothetical protein